MTLGLIGYFAKRALPAPEWLSGTGAREICSVSECLAPGAPGWIDRWTHNDWGFFNSVDDALSVLSDETNAFQLLAFSLLDRRFENGTAVPIQVPPGAIEPLPASFEALGFDAPSKSGSGFFECSPLLCNGMAREIKVNRYCLLDDLETAVEVAVRFSVEQPEPGPYYVVHVHRAKNVE